SSQFSETTVGLNPPPRIAAHTLCPSTYASLGRVLQFDIRCRNCTNVEASAMTDDRLRSYGVFLLRVALGTMFLAHSTIYMLMTLTLVGTAKFFVSIGLPAWLAYATFLVEAVGGILLILGIQTRWV